MRFKVPAMAALGVAQIASLELRYVELPALIEQIVIRPTTVYVVPGDEAVGRVANPVGRSERLYQDAQLSKKEASRAFERDDVESGKRLLSRRCRAWSRRGWTCRRSCPRTSRPRPAPWGSCRCRLTRWGRRTCRS